MRKLAAQRLENERYLECDGLTIESIIEAEIMAPFETDMKRSFNLWKKNEVFSFRLRGLKESLVDPILKQNAFVLQQ